MNTANSSSDTLPDSPRRVVLDSFAMLAWLRSEPSADVVEDLLHRARDGEIELAMAVVNLGEVVYRTIRDSGKTRADVALMNLRRHSITLHDVDESLALAGAEIKGEHRMSYADCIAAALALRLGAELATGDPEFRQVEDHVRVLWLERAGRASEPEA